MPRATKTSAKKKPAVKVGDGKAGTQASKLSLKLVIPVVIVVAVIGGFLVFKSSASTNYAKVWQPGTPDVTLDAKMSVVPKNNGTKAWAIKFPAVPKTDPGFATIQIMSWNLLSSMKLTSAGSGPGTYCAEITNGVKSVGVVLSQDISAFTDGKASSRQEPKGYQSLPKNTKKDVCVTADLSSKPLYLHLIEVRSNGGPENERPATATIIHKFYKQKTRTL